VEFLIYFLILGIVMTAITSFMFDVIQTRTRVKVAVEVDQNVRLSMQRVLRALRTADSLNNGASAFGDPDGVLALDMADPSADPTVFDLLDGVLRVTEGAGSPVDLTTPDVFVDRFWIARDNLSGGSRSVTVQLEVRSVNLGEGNVFEYSSSASSTAVIRKQR
jgi:hypothetical protein